ncbi:MULTISPECIES: DUF6796 family protein [unclassified Butyrivibrio]|uniref:DUF6796 family protein n=1 Tax=unclassified Butyrivibrio TaxID=2639466 RepID=UPI00047A2F58|nr:MULTISPECIES: DUF6796 family protein [unclassified Butyrivibrio]MDC7294490.1 hypothetical protein [Butyrivibrio sp. DSM 10294]
MKNLTSRQKIMFGVYSMILAIIGDYLLGYGTFSTSSSPDAYMGVEWSVAPDWRYAVSSILGFACATLFAVAAVELLRVMEKKYHLNDSKLFGLFKIANWSGILYFAFIHIGICMLPVVFNAGMAATGDVKTSADMVFRVLKSIAVPMGIGFVVCDVFVTIAWIGMVFKKMIPVKKAAFICCPVITSILGQLMNYISEGLDSGFESFGWLLMYLVCALSLVDKDEREWI